MIELIMNKMHYHQLFEILSKNGQVVTYISSERSHVLIPLKDKFGAR